jgi:hypothetical protein
MPPEHCKLSKTGILPYGSFVLASTIFKFIVQPATEEDPRTPMDCLPLTQEMNDLDGLYFQTLTRLQHLPHF